MIYHSQTTASGPARVGPQESASFEIHEHVSRGVALHAQGRFHEALSEYRQALELDNQDAYAHYLMGLALRAIGRYQDATSEWEEARVLRAHDEASAWGLALARKLLDSDL